MSFLYPWFLLSLFAIAVPVIIHLFQFRRYKKIYFPNISFLETLEQESKKQSKLRHLWVLLMRILAITSLALAFSGPYLDADEDLSSVENNLISVYIDNSFSMENGTGNQTYLDRAKNHAREIAGFFSPSDKYQILTNDLEGKHQRFVSRDEFLQYVTEIEISPVATTINTIVKRQSALFNDQPGNNSQIGFIISDFQTNSLTTDDWPVDSLSRFFFLPVSSSQRYNVSIDSVWIDNPLRISNQSLTLQARLTNHSADSVNNIPVRLFINDSQRAVATFSAREKSSSNVVFNFTPGEQLFQNGRLEISDPAIIFDDTFFFSFNVGETIPVLSIHQTNPNPFVKTLLSLDSAFRIVNVYLGVVDFSSLGGNNMVILDGVRQPTEGLINEIGSYVNQGGNLLILPAPDSDLTAYNRLMQQLNAPSILGKDTIATRISSLDSQHPLFYGVFESIPENIDFPNVRQHYRFERRTAGNEQTIMTFENGDPFFISLPSGRGRVFISSVAIDDSFSDFQRNAIFVPVLYNTVVQSATFYPLYHTIALNDMIQVRNYMPGSGELFRVVSDGNEIIPETRTNKNVVDLFIHGQIRESGHKLLMAGDSTLRSISFNYDRSESVSDYYSYEQMNDLVSDNNSIKSNLLTDDNVPLPEQVNRLMSGHFLWKYLLMAALLFVLLESAVLRFVK